MTKRISQVIHATLQNEACRPGDTPTFSDFLAAYQDGLKSVGSEDLELVFRCAIVNDGQCGFANGGSNQYLVNTDQGRDYRVTVRTYWRQGIDQGQYDNTYTINAGARLFLGCTDSGNIPVAYYNRQVVGEVGL